MNNNFIFHIPTKIIFGTDSVEQSLLNELNNPQRVFIVTGKSSAKKSGALGDIESVLNKNKISYKIHDHITANPSLQEIEEGAQVARNFDPQIIIAIGGGSPLDAAKAIAFLMNNNYKGDEIFTREPEAPIPQIIAVPTTAGTGSEVTPYAIITDPSVKNKRNLSHKKLFPACAILDPKYTESLPLHITINTAVDALSHAIEGFLSKRSNQMSNLTALQAIETLAIGLKTLSKGEDANLETRKSLLMGSMLAGIVIAQSGTTALHAMGYPLTYYRNIDHGHANGLLMAAYLEFCNNGEQGNKFTAIVKAMNLKNFNELKDLLNRLIKTNETFTKNEIELFTKTAISASNIKSTNPQPEYDDIHKIFTMSLTVKG
jgi:alcohol dehydrogenase class IV